MRLGPCQICNEPEDTVGCAECNRSVCYECCRWLHEEDDPPNGEWYCYECVPEEGDE
jgi:hypothetical protein